VFDVYYLVSANTDLAPAIRMVKKEFPRKESAMPSKRRFTIIEYTIIGTAVLFALFAVYFGLSR